MRYYKDPTANAAIGNVCLAEKHERHRLEKERARKKKDDNTRIRRAWEELDERANNTRRPLRPR